MAPDTRGPAVTLVALLASAGGLDAVSTVLRDLPAEFPAAIIVQQHLGNPASALPAILGRQTAHRVGWAQEHQAVTPGVVLVCPPGKYLEVTPDGHCHLGTLDRARERRFDIFLRSMADAYGPRGVGVVLSGSGRDGAAGTAAMKRAGAIMIAESPDTAQYRSMPVAAARAGADLVLPIHEIGDTLAGIVRGARPPAPRATGATAGTGGPAKPAVSEPPDAAPRDGLPDPLPDHAMSSAAQRAEIARLRAGELRRRREELASGFGATAQTVAAARLRARESRRRAQLAYQASMEAAARWGH
ncbi:chemotaxis protein CheB [Mycobacterium saskatchewanense]|uniref:protein-glutamate methylesterase n=1 Tax=Mycobacterium saskatchewanense TaxID=220927 RepID=A0AAJ3NRS5_9MYCO|nr:chemotaxis protein CheB [Mycobacterium saskatchewanense]ORW73270.1 hypothetical protein AWC23_07470 [Mycobacterium saskatchewanense]